MRIGFSAVSGVRVVLTPCRAAGAVALALLFCLVASGPASAAGEVPVRARAEPFLSWRDALTITLEPDEAVCRGSANRDTPACRGSLGEEGAPVPGMDLRPAVAGVWRWRNGNQLVFMPEQSLAPGTAYTANLRAVPLPRGTVLITPQTGPAAQAAKGERRVTLVTIPLAAAVDDLEVWIDPAPKGRHVVSATIRFSWPVNPVEMEARIALRPVADSSRPGPRLGKETFVWNHDRDEVTVSAPVLTPAETKRPVEVRVRGGALWDRGASSLRRAARRTADGDVTGRVLAPGRQELFQVRRLELAGGRNASLDWEYRLELETSLPVAPAAVVKALRVTALPRNISPRPGSAERAEADRPYDWLRAPVVSAEDLARGTPVRVTLASGGADAQEPTSRLSLRLDARAGAYLFVSLPAGFVSAEGFPLARGWRGVLKAVPPEPEVNFLQPGHVLPLGGTRAIALHASGLTAIRWELRRVREPFLALLAEENRGFADDSVADSHTEVARGEIPLPTAASDTGSGAGAGSEAGSGPETSSGVEQGRARFATLNVAESWPFGLMEARLTGMNGERRAAFASRLVLLTDMGMFVKKASDGRRDIFVCSLASGRPVRDAAVRVLGRNGLPVAEVFTDSQGHAVLPATDGLKGERAPVAIVAARLGSKDEMVDFTWLSLSDSARVVNQREAFSTGGLSARADGLIAYVFSQRGLFRPGETLHFGCVVRRGDWQALPDRLPLHAVLTDPLGNEVLSRPLTVPEDGLAELSWTAPEAAPVGRYRLDLRIGERGPVIGSGETRVEEFQPDTLELRVNIVAETAGTPEAAPQAGPDAVDAVGAADAQSGDPAPSSPSGGRRGWIVIGDDAGVKAVARLRNLYGLPAQNRRVRATLALAPASFSFPGYEDYRFYDAAPYRDAHAVETLPEARTDADGRAAFTLPVWRYPAATVRASLFTEGFEPGGGRAVTRVDSVLLSPLRVALGFRPAEEATNLGHIPQGRKAALDFVALGPDLNRADPGPLTFTVSARRSVRSLIRDARGRYRYDETPVEAPLTRSEARCDERGNLRWFLPTDTPGDFVLTVTSAAGEPLAEAPFTVAGNAVRVPDPHGRNLAPGALRLRLDKAAYAPGGTIRIALAAPYAGSGLLTVERDGVVAWRWFRAEAGENVQSIDLPPDFEGKGYVTAALIRSPDSPDIYMEPLSSAVAAFSVDPGRRDMGLRLSAPRRVRPGERVAVTVNSRESGRVVVFAVDEGVLSATDFRTPAPLDHLLRNRALDVETRQMFDLIMPDQARLAGRLPAFGGGMDGAGGGRFLNPFKRRGDPPLAVWSSLIPVSSEGGRFSFTVPESFSGEVRIMAVGATAGAVGSAEARLTARGPVTLTPQLPLAVAPGDCFEAAVGIANNADEAGPNESDEGESGEDAGEAWGEAALFRLRVETEGGLVLADGARQAVLPPVRIRRGDETVLRFDLSAPDTPDAPGEARVRLTAEAIPSRPGQEQAAPPDEDAAWESARATTRTVSLSVRPASPFRQSVLAGTAGGGETRVPVRRERFALGRSDVFEASRVPLPLLRGLARRLDLYPHGCTEQLISRAFPYVVLASRPDLLIDPRRDTAAVVRDGEAVIDGALRALRGSCGHNGVSLWPGGSPNETLTVYAGDFLLALREAGRPAPASLEQAVFDAIERLTERSPRTLAGARIKAYGLWVLTREGRIVTPAIDELEQRLNELRNDGTGQAEWRRDVAATLLAGACSLLRLDERAERLILPTDAGPTDAGSAGSTVPLENDDAAGAADAFPTGAILDATAAAALRATVLSRQFPDRLSDHLAGDAGRTRLEASLDRLAGAVYGREIGTFAAAHSVRALLALSLASPAFAVGDAAGGTAGAEGARIDCADAGEALASSDLSDPVAPSAPAGLADAAGGPDAALKASLSVPGLHRLEGACSAFRLRVPAGETWYWQLTSGGYDRTPPTQAESRGMEVALAVRGSALSPDESLDGPLPVTLGDVITLAVTARSYGDPIPNAVITVPLPGGFEALPFREEGEATDAPFTHRETREDRVLLYVDLTSEPRTWTCRLRAVNTGRFVLPPVQAEAMYDATLSGRSVPGGLEVRQPPDMLSGTPADTPGGGVAP